MEPIGLLRISLPYQLLDSSLTENQSHRQKAWKITESYFVLPSKKQSEI